MSCNFLFFIQQYFAKSLPSHLLWFGSVSQRSMCRRLGPQPTVLLGGSGTLKRWGLVEGSEVTGGHAGTLALPSPFASQLP
jgi:hypothetical protein